MKKFVFHIIFLCTSFFAKSQTDLIVNGNFQSGASPWIYGSSYWNYATTSNSVCIPTLTNYGYHGNADGSGANNSFGSMYQDVTIPANTTTAILQFNLSINTQETTTSQIFDSLKIQFRSPNNNQLLYTFASFSNLNGIAGSCRPFTAFTYAVPSGFFGQSVRVNFQGANDGSLPTVFRIDNVSLNVTTGCISWVNGSPPANPLVTAAAEYLCQQGIIDNVYNAQFLSNMPICEAALNTISGLYNGNPPATFITDNYPTLFTDLDNLPFYYYQSVKALCFLDYNDGRSCIRREYNQIYPTLTIEHGYSVRLLLEAWNIAPDTTGWDAYSHTPSTFACNIFRDDINYGYFQKAFQIGLLNNYITGGCFSYGNQGEFFLVMLYRLHSQFSHPSITNDFFYTPNNFTKVNGAIGADVERGVFKIYEQNGFSIPGGGLGLDFDFSYHSDWLDMPSIPNSGYVSGYEYLKEIRAKHKIYPVGNGWTHSYNSFAHVVRDDLGNDVYFIFKWGNGDVAVYNVQQQKFETKGVYDELIPDQIVDGRIRAFFIKTKSQIKYLFYRDNTATSDQFIFDQILDRNGNRVTVQYEQAVCSQPPINCINAINRRIKSVTDLATGRMINFNYQPGTDLLAQVTDNTNRSILFYVNKFTHNLDSSTNARGYTTKYKYCIGDTCSNMLIEIQRPKGNWIKNSYAKRKLRQTQTPNYSASVSFNSNYNPGNQTTSSTIQVTPTAGAGYTTTYQHNSLGQPTNVSSSVSSSTIQYNDPNNPTLPTSVTDNLTGVTTTNVYDAKGNTTTSTTSGGSIVQTTTAQYNSFNDVVQTQLPNGSIFNYTYDAYGNLLNESGPLGHANSYTRNPNGTINTKTNANNIISRFGYNAFGNVNQVSIDNSPIQAQAVYDNVSRIIAVKDANNTVSGYVYDNNDNIIKTIVDTAGLKLTTQYRFDPNDNNDLVIAPKGDSTKLTFDQNDDLVREDYGNNFRVWGYYDDGSLKYYNDKRGYQFSRSYFSSGSGFEGLLQQSDGNILEYYPTSKLLKSTQRGNNKVSFTYDGLQRINSTKLEAAIGNFVSDVNYEYDASGFQTKIIIPAIGKFYRYVPDALNRIAEVYDWNNNLLVRYNYRPDGNLVSEQLGNGVVVSYHYDSAGRLDSIYAKKSNDTLLYAIGAGLDNLGNHTRESYYVNKGSLPVHSFNLNDSLVNYQYDYTNRLTTTNAQTATGDNAGNILNNAYTGFNNGSYDFWGYLTNASVDGKNHSFSYDPLDNRFRTDTTLYIQDLLNNGNVLATRTTASPVITNLYCHSRYGLVCSIDPNTNQKRWYLYDFRGSTVAILDDNQNVVEYYKYESFGQIEEASVATPGITTPFLYVGRYGVEYQSQHLYYMRARYYDPSNGRFYGEDPVWNTNLFLYAENNPITNIDPNGRASLKISPYSDSDGQPIYSLEQFYNANKGKSFNDIINQNKPQKLFGIEFPGGPSMRYVLNPNDGKVMDMRHVMVVGYQYGNTIGAFVEVGQLVHKRTRPSSLKRQDFYSNFIGNSFRISTKKIISDSSQWVDIFYYWLPKTTN